MKNTALNLLCVAIGTCLILAGAHNFLSASPGTSGAYKEFLVLMGLTEENSVSNIQKEINAIPEETGEEVETDNKINVSIEDLLTREDVVAEEDHIHSWEITQEYNWVDLGNGRGRMEIIDIEKCECGTVK